MQIGAAMFFTSYSMRPGELAQALEQRGFESIWAPEHSHIPLSRQSPWGGGDVLPQHYYDVMDPFVSLTAAAMVTTRLKLGTGVCLVVQRDPIQTAKLVASIDQISSGRFLFGVGNGWNAEEMADHGTAFASRHKLARERIEAMRAIWTQDQPEYSGEFVTFPPMVCNPKPVQQPHPPVIVGGAWPYGARRAARYGNGWMPLLGRQAIPLEKLIPDFHALLREAGRDPADVPLTIWGTQPDADAIKRARDLGIQRMVTSLPSRGAAETLPELDRWADIIRQVA